MASHLYPSSLNNNELISMGKKRSRKRKQTTRKLAFEFFASVNSEQPERELWGKREGNLIFSGFLLFLLMN